MSIPPTRDAVSPHPDRAEGTSPVGVLLAAGAGRRMGTPKALVIGDDGEPWIARGLRVLREGGCERVVVVLGAAPEAESLIPLELRRYCTVVVADDWAQGQSASLRAGIRAVQALEAEGTGSPLSAVVTLVDLPGLHPAALRRVVAAASSAAPSSPTASTSNAAALLQAAYEGRPGHPVFLGRSHLAPLLDHLHGDTGARPYLREHGVRMIDCTDLGGGDDVDGPG